MVQTYTGTGKIEADVSDIANWSVNSIKDINCNYDTCWGLFSWRYTLYKIIWSKCLNKCRPTDELLKIFHHFNLSCIFFFSGIKAFGCNENNGKSFVLVKTNESTEETKDAIFSMKKLDASLLNYFSTLHTCSSLWLFRLLIAEGVGRGLRIRVQYCSQY